MLKRLKRPQTSEPLWPERLAGWRCHGYGVTVGRGGSEHLQSLQKLMGGRTCGSFCFKQPGSFRPKMKAHLTRPPLASPRRRRPPPHSSERLKRSFTTLAPECFSRIKNRFSLIASGSTSLLLIGQIADESPPRSRLGHIFILFLIEETNNLSVGYPNIFTPNQRTGRSAGGGKAGWTVCCGPQR